MEVAIGFEEIEVDVDEEELLDEELEDESGEAALLVAKYDAFVTRNVHSPDETVQVAGETIPSVVQLESGLIERTIFNVWLLSDAPK